MLLGKLAGQVCRELDIFRKDFMSPVITSVHIQKNSLMVNLLLIASSKHLPKCVHDCRFPFTKIIYVTYLIP